MAPKPFRIGVNMAGAVSAGAYTAGVLDFLIEALDTWYEAKERYNRELADYKKTAEYRKYCDYLHDFRKRQAAQLQGNVPKRFPTKHCILTVW